MKFTNEAFIDILIGSGLQANNLVDSFFIISKLIKKHGKMIYTKKYITEISNIDKSIGELIYILKIVNIINYVDVKKLINILKLKSKGYKKEFIIKSDSKDHAQKIISYLDQNFIDSKSHIMLNDDMGVSVSGEGRYYKKSLDSDLQKILGK